MCGRQKNSLLFLSKRKYQHSLYRTISLLPSCLLMFQLILIIVVVAFSPTDGFTLHGSILPRSPSRRFRNQALTRFAKSRSTQGNVGALEKSTGRFDQELTRPLEESPLILGDSWRDEKDQVVAAKSKKAPTASGVTSSMSVFTCSLAIRIMSDVI